MHGDAVDGRPARPVVSIGDVARDDGDGLRCGGVRNHGGWPTGGNGFETKERWAGQDLRDEQGGLQADEQRATDRDPPVVHQPGNDHVTVAGDGLEVHSGEDVRDPVPGVGDLDEQQVTQWAEDNQHAEDERGDHRPHRRGCDRQRAGAGPVVAFGGAHDATENRAAHGVAGEADTADEHAHDSRAHTTSHHRAESVSCPERCHRRDSRGGDDAAERQQPAHQAQPNGEVGENGRLRQLQWVLVHGLYTTAQSQRRRPSG